MSNAGEWQPRGPNAHKDSIHLVPLLADALHHRGVILSGSPVYQVVAALQRGQVRVATVSGPIECSTSITAVMAKDLSATQ